MAQEGTQGAQHSLVEAVRHVMINLISQARGRLQLLSLEIAEERERVIALVITALVSCFFVFLTVVFGAMLIVAKYWDTPYRLSALGWLVGTAAVIAVLGIVLFVMRLRTPTPLFAHSLAEFDKDKRALETIE